MNFSSDVISMVKPTPKQTFIGIWFYDKNTSDDQQNRMRLYLNRTFYYYRTFSNVKDFTIYMNEERLVVSKIFLIISHITLYFPLVKLAQNYKDLFQKIYVFLPVNVHIDDAITCFATSCKRRLFEELSKDILEYTIKENPSNIITNHTDVGSDSEKTYLGYEIPPLGTVSDINRLQITPIHHLTKESLKFLHILTMNNILCRMSYDRTELSEMWTALRNLYPENHTQLDCIDKLARCYQKDDAVKYYTESSCVSRVINQACHTENIQRIYTFRSYISDLYKKLHSLDDQENQKKINTPIPLVFRGKPLSGSVLQKLIDSVGGLISMNGFLSTSKNSDVAVPYHGDEQVGNGYRSVLFRLHIDNNIKQPYADISGYSTKPDEEEILFSLGTIWHIESVKHNEKPCVVELTPYNAMDSQLTELFEKHTEEGCNLLSLGNILYELGDDVTAEWFYRRMLEQDCLHKDTRGKLYYKIGVIRLEKEDYPIALDNFEKSTHFLESSDSESFVTELPKLLYKCDNKSPLTTIYSNKGFLHAKNGRLDEAVKCYMKALKGTGSDLEIATVHNAVGLLYFGDGQYDKARYHHEKAIETIANNHHLWVKFKQNFDRADQHLNHIQTMTQTKTRPSKKICPVS